MKIAFLFSSVSSFSVSYNPSAYDPQKVRPFSSFFRSGNLFLKQYYYHHVQRRHKTTKTYPTASAFSNRTSSTQKEQEIDHDIQLICCDLDGTILDRRSQISSRNIITVKRLISQKSAIFVPATGKSRAGALRSMRDLGKYLQEYHNGRVPGVYLQGLIVYGKDGKLVYENVLDEHISWRVVQHAKHLGVALAAYSGDRLVAVDKNKRTMSITDYHENEPIYMSNWKDIIGKIPLHKLLFIDDPMNINHFRSSVENILANDATVTQAVEDVLEVLPLGASKGHGVLQLLKSFNVHPRHVMAIGDGENDLEMMHVVGVSVAMGNALNSIKSVARFTVDTNDDHGVSEAIERFVLSRDKARVAQV